MAARLQILPFFWDTFFGKGSFFYTTQQKNLTNPKKVVEGKNGDMMIPAKKKVQRLQRLACASLFLNAAR